MVREREGGQVTPGVVKVDIRKTGHSWSQLERMAQNRDLWQTVVDGQCPRRSDGLR